MRYLVFFLLAACFLGCTKAKEDTFTFKCTTTWQLDPFTTTSRDTLLLNYTDNQANNYVRITSINGRTTICKKQ